MAEIDWQSIGIDPADFPDCRGSGPLLIVGCGRCVHEDLDGFPVDKHSVMAINDIGCHLHAKIDHWYSNHAAHLPLWRQMRYARHRYKPHDPKPPKMHSASDHAVHGVLYWPVPNSAGSGLAAAYVGLAMGYSPIVLAAMPMDACGHYFDPPIGHSMQRVRLSSFDGQKYEKFWRRANEMIFKGRVKSLSGNTRHWLGAP